MGCRINVKKALKRCAIAICCTAGFLGLMAGGLYGVALYYRNTLPDEYKLSTNTLSVPLPKFFLTKSASADDNDESVAQAGSWLADSISQPSERVSISLFGIIPVKEVGIQRVDMPMVVPGGTPFGIKLLTEGVLVIGLTEVAEGTAPAAQAGITPGDVVVSMNGKSVSSKNDVAEAVKDSRGSPMEVVVSHNGSEREVTLEPVFSKDSGSWQAGMWVRDSTAGIGTVTFYDPATGAFGGLGHPVCDVDTGELIPMSTGEVAKVSINGITRGAAGRPGELLGSFVPSAAYGTLSSNTQAGLFGRLYAPPSLAAPIPIAARDEIKTGSAEILSTISGNTPKSYSVEIERLDRKEATGTRNMIIKVTDPELLSLTGGIVQGMSGSPIIQNGKLVGAVTHVFLRDPSKGYGIFADSMYQKTLEVVGN